jgi:5-(aminomethyl)-3-furanmethanol phosphate kinase
MHFFVLKLGGSLMDVARRLLISLKDMTTDGYSFLVIPGGGPMANLVRKLFEKYYISQEIAHWMAILSMEQYGYFLTDKTGVESIKTIERIEGIRILLPYQALIENDLGLEHNWDCTSDSVAAWISAILDANFIKITDIDGVIIDGKVVKEVHAGDLIGIPTCIDQGALHLLKGRTCWILNGSHPEEFIASLKTGIGGTVIKG